MILPLRSYIRHALVRLFRENDALAEALGESIYPNRWDAWHKSEFPALGLYLKNETALDPQRCDRRLVLEAEVYVLGGSELDDELDFIALNCELAFNLDKLGAALEDMGVKDTIINGYFESSSMDMMGDGAEEVLGVMVLSFTLDYRVYEDMPPLPDFLHANTRWRLAGDNPEEIVAENDVFFTAPE